jgi:hypothetical protein
LLATEPPVDVEALTQRFRDTIEAEGVAALWVLEDDGRLVGNAHMKETGYPGVLSFGMAILPESRPRRRARSARGDPRSCSLLRRAQGRVEVWRDNAPRGPLYGSAGFEVEGLRRDHFRRKDGSLRSALLMARLIGRERE